MPYLLVLSTTSSENEAKKLAKILLQLRLAACINIIPRIESHYWWKGKKESSREALMLIKTKASAFARLEKTIRRHHSYSVPEVIALPIQKGSRPYLAWLTKEVGAS